MKKTLDRIDYEILALLRNNARISNKEIARKVGLAAFRNHALGLPEVVHLYHVAGPIDFLIHVWARVSNHLRDLAMTAFTSREEVSHIETELIFEHIRSAEVPSFANVESFQ